MKNGMPLFVYGTLRPGERLWPYVDKFVDRHERATADGLALFMYDAYAFPYAAREPGSGIAGDLLWLNDADACLAVTDRVEGHPHHYRRQLVTVQVDGGASVDAWTYLFEQCTDDMVKIPGGDWLGDRKGVMVLQVAKHLAGDLRRACRRRKLYLGAVVTQVALQIAERGDLDLRPDFGADPGPGAAGESEKITVKLTGRELARLRHACGGDERGHVASGLRSELWRFASGGFDAARLAEISDAAAFHPGRGGRGWKEWERVRVER